MIFTLKCSPLLETFLYAIQCMLLREKNALRNHIIWINGKKKMGTVDHLEEHLREAWLIGTLEEKVH